MSGIPAVKTEDLTKIFKEDSIFKRKHKVKALDKLNIEINKGEVFGYLGPNGAGKTTTFKLLMGLLYPTSGKAWVMGEKISNYTFKQRVGFLPEQPYFYDHLTGEEFLDFYAELFQLDKKTRKQRVQNILEAVGLEDSASKHLRKYSRGMLQRIGIAQALINDPELVILDEPLSGLDPIGRKEIRDIILDLKKQGRTIIFSSHILSDVEALCDKIGILMKGKIQHVEDMNQTLSLELESVEITVAGLSDEGKNVIQSLGGELMTNGDKTIVAVHGLGFPEGEETISKVLDTIRSYSGKLVSMMSRSQSLEDLFMKLNSQVHQQM
ncbi:ATP-binding cassette domain-containing protein [Candidatus Poribacteria bacterium]|nr:ATP-binding cassette domain-containing protein [Candidatus Poribacteria bacterium]